MEYNIQSSSNQHVESDIVVDSVYQAWDAMFHHFWRILWCFICWWNIVSNACYYFPNKMILDWEFKGAKMSRFSSDFQTLIKHWFPLYFLYELLMSLRKQCMLLVFMYDLNSNISILFLKKNQNYTKLIALHMATKLIKGDNTVTKRKVTQ